MTEKRMYEVIIDRSSTHLDIEATSEEEAAKIGYKQFRECQEKRDDFEFWVGEVDYQQFVSKRE